MEWLKQRGIPKGVRLISLATAVRWFGWGIVEALIPVFLFQVSNTYAVTGVLGAIYSFVFLLALPCAGMLADRVSARTLLIIGILIYPFIGLSYTLAGLTGFVSLIVIARALNGLAYAFDSVGRGAYFRNHSNNKIISMVFGYFGTLTNLWWMMGLALALFLVSFVPMTWLFMAIIPTSVISLVMFLHLDNDGREKLGDGFRNILSKGIYRSMFKETRRWNGQVRFAGLIEFFSAFIGTLVSFFLPIYAYLQNESLLKIVGITLILASPGLLGNYFGRIADKKRTRCIYVGLVSLFGVLLLLSVVKMYALYLVAALVMGTVLELLSITNTGIATIFTKRGHYGRLSSAMNAVSELGDIVGTLAIGFLIDRIGMQDNFLVIAALTLGVLIVFWRMRGSLDSENA